MPVGRFSEMRGGTGLGHGLCGVWVGNYSVDVIVSCPTVYHVVCIIATPSGFRMGKQCGTDHRSDAVLSRSTIGPRFGFSETTTKRRGFPRALRARDVPQQVPPPAGGITPGYRGLSSWACQLEPRAQL